MSLLEQLQALPDDWAFVAVDGNKRAYQEAWQDNPLTKAQIAAEINAGCAHAVGVQGGPASGGLLFVDHDGISATTQLERLGIPLRSLPKSWATTSGRDGRFQILYRVPPEFWPALRNRRYWYTGEPDPTTGKPTKVLGPDGKAEMIDFRWARHYSVVIGAHPETSGYRWLKGRGPTEQALVDAPHAIIELLLDEPEPEPLPLFTPEAVPQIGPGDPLPFLDFISRDSRELVESGGTPGSWNDDQLRLALDLRGTEQWIRSQGHQPDITASQAFALHVAAAKPKARDFDERKAWHRFDGAASRNPRPSTPEDKLQDRLRFHTRTSRPLLPPPSTTPQQQQAPPGPPPPDPPPPPQQAYAPTLAKPQKLEAAELLFMLRQQAQDGQRIRWNTFHQQVEIDGGALEGAERFYLKLADQGFKVSKDLAIDALVQVAREKPYDPVTLYLEHVAATVPPAYIGGLATAYLRPEDAALGEPTLYDHMLRCTLIGAVRRAFEPGTKHDTTCILSGDQGARKSSFWFCLGGPFFSDSLGDLSSKDDLLKLHRSWIMEWAELDHVTSRKHAGQIKSFLTTQSDLFRAPYGKAVEACPRRGIIVGSTNRSEGFLVDDTGNRRFWVIPTTRNEAEPIDTPTLAAERDAIWSAAVHAFRANEPNFLPVELALKVNAENEAYQVSNPWREPIEAWLRQPANFGRIVTSELLLTEAVQKPIGQQTRTDQMQVGTIMRDLGWGRVRRRHDGGLKWVFIPPS
jgi:predicted P-loop ATPase